MYPTDAFVIRKATSEDEAQLRRLEQLEGIRLSNGSVLLGEIDGAPAAAISLADQRVVADPFKHTTVLVQLLQMRSRALQSYERTPSLPDRLRATFAPFRGRTAPAEG
jgi:hypothetical protein